MVENFAHIAEHDREIAQVTAGREKSFWIFGNFLDHLRRHEVGELVVNSLLVPVRDDVVVDRQRTPWQQNAERGIDRAEQEPV